MSAPRRKLPLGIQTFRTLREEGCYYVDKTPFIRQLVDEGSRYFLSRPRRFGKSLLVDTIKALFEGREKLFRGLAIHDGWDWSTTYPVVRLDFGTGSYAEPEGLARSIGAQLDRVERQHSLTSPYAAAPERFDYLLEALHERADRRVVVLVDEYDKPILDALVQDPDLAVNNRDQLRTLYSVIKTRDADIKFTLLTGVSKFAKVSLFSDLNNLTDLTLKPAYSALCGYTDEDLDTVFEAELRGLDRDAVREWYNGYSWRGAKVYNPYDVLRLFDDREFDAHWFETGSPSFVVSTLLDRGVATPALDGMVAGSDLLSSFDVRAMSVEALLFQGGYLTIAETVRRGRRPHFRLGYPNREVRESLNDHLLRALTPEAANRVLEADALVGMLDAGDFAGVEALVRALFDSIPYNWHVNNGMAHYEGYYASVFYSYFAATGLDVRAEDATSRGRLDMAVRADGRVWLFELKVVEQAVAGAAMSQLKERGYAGKYRRPGVAIHLVAIEFSSKLRNVASFSVETV